MFYIQNAVQEQSTKSIHINQVSEKNGFSKNDVEMFLSIFQIVDNSEDDENKTEGIISGKAVKTLKLELLKKYRNKCATLMYRLGTLSDTEYSKECRKRLHR